MSNSTAPIAPEISAEDLQTQAVELYGSTVIFFRAHWLHVLIAIGFGILIFLALQFVKSLGNRLCRRDPTGTGWYTVLGRAIGKTGNFFMAMTAAQLVIAGSRSLHPPVELLEVIHFLFTIAAVFQSATWAREIILGAIEHRTSVSSDRGEALSNAMGLIRIFVSFAVFAIALVMVLGNLGVNITGLVAGLGVGGIAIGLAAQSVFADLIAAVSIIFDRPFGRGDAITYDKSSGTVEQIGMRSTRIRGVNGEQRVIGNKKLLDFEIINNTQREYRRIIFTLSVVQTTPIKVMEELPHILKDIVEDHGAKFVRAGFTGFGTQSYDFDLEFDSPTAVFQDMYDARHSIGLSIIKRFNDDGIALAYPTQTGLTAEEAGMIQPRKQRPIKESNETIARPPSSGDRSAADQEGSS